MSTKLDQLVTLLIKAARLAAELQVEEPETAPRRGESDGVTIGELHRFA